MISSFHRFVARSPPFLFLPFRCARGSDKFVLIDDEIFERKEKKQKKKRKKRSEKWCANRAKGDDKGIPEGNNRGGMGEKGRGVWMFGISGIYLGDENV